MRGMVEIAMVKMEGSEEWLDSYRGKKVNKKGKNSIGSMEGSHEPKHREWSNG